MSACEYCGAAPVDPADGMYCARCAAFKRTPGAGYMPGAAQALGAAPAPVDYSRYHYGTEYLCPVCREWCDGSDRDPFDRLRACDACAAPAPAPAHSFTTRVDLVRRYRYFRAQGERAHYSLYLARKEIEAERRGWYVSWESETECFCESDSDCECMRPWNSCACEYASVWRYTDTDTERLSTALGGICGADDAYRRVVAAELYSAELDAERETRAAQDRNAAQTERAYASAGWAAL